MGRLDYEFEERWKSVDTVNEPYLDETHVLQQKIRYPTSQQVTETTAPMDEHRLVSISRLISDSNTMRKLEREKNPDLEASEDAQTPFDGENVDKEPTLSHGYFEYCPECGSHQIWFGLIEAEKYLECEECGSRWKKTDEKGGGMLSNESRWKEIEGENMGDLKSLSQWQ